MKTRIKKLKRIIRNSAIVADQLGYKGFRKFLIYFDICYCRLFLHCKFEEYKLYRFDHFKNFYRKNFLLVYNQVFTFGKLNSSNLENGKISQYELFKDYIGRDWIKVEPTNIDAVKEFAKKHKKVLLKPARGSLGKGIYTYDANVDSDKMLIKIILSAVNKQYICEEYVYQHPSIAKFHEKSLNCIRVLTFNNDEEIKILSASIKLGISDNVVDNMAHEGIGAAIDLDTGIVKGPAYDHDGNPFYLHPESKEKIIGFEIPYFDKVKELAIKCAELTKANRVIGWDIAIKEDGPIIIEMNNRPGTYLIQAYDRLPHGKEIKDFEKNNKDKLVKMSKKEIEDHRYLI